MIAGLIPLIIGLVCTVVGGFLTLSGYYSFAYLSDLEGYVAFTPSQLISQPQEQQGYVEGVISDRNPVLIEGMVAYIRSDYRGMNKRWVSNPNTMNADDPIEERRPIWQEDERQTPALRLQVADAGVDITAGYRIEQPPHIWLTTPTYEIGVTKQYEGFRVGDPVVAVGRTLTAQRSPYFQAQALHSGTFADYRSSYRTGGWFGVIAGLVLLLVGIIAVIVGGVLLAPLVDFL